MRNLFLLALTIISTFSHADIINCSVSVQNNFSDEPDQLNVSIFIPQTQNFVVGLYDTDSAEFDSFISIDEVAKGSIQLNSKSGLKREYDLIVTVVPGGGSSLIGYYINQGYIASVKANLWDDNKPIYIHDTGMLTNNLMVGNCH